VSEWVSRVSISPSATGSTVLPVSPGRHHPCVGTLSPCGTGTCRQAVPLGHPRLIPSDPARDDLSPSQQSLLAPIASPLSFACLSTTSTTPLSHASLTARTHGDVKSNVYACMIAVNSYYTVLAAVVQKNAAFIIFAITFGRQTYWATTN